MTGCRAGARLIANEQQHRERWLAGMEAATKSLGFQVIPLPVAKTAAARDPDSGAVCFRRVKPPRWRRTIGQVSSS